MNTPWDIADHVVTLVEGEVYSVDTPGHGGILVRADVAEKYLSPAAQAEGWRWNEWYAYEEDENWAFFAYENPQLYAEKMAQHLGRPLTAEEVKQKARDSLTWSHADFLKQAGDIIVYTIGIGPTTDIEQDPYSWKFFMNFLELHPHIAIVDLRFLRNELNEKNPWNGIRLTRHFLSQQDYTYIPQGHLLTSLHGIDTESKQQFMHVHIAIKRLVAILNHDKHIVCLSEERQYEGSIRQNVVDRIRKQLPAVVSEELRHYYGAD